jgi:hypothetical protein
MYGCGDAHLVYGFNLERRDIKFDGDWIYDKYPAITCYAVDIVRNYLGEPIYGVPCDLDLLTGKVTQPTEEQEKVVTELYNKYIEYYTKNFGDKYAKNIKLGYHLAVSGWDEEEHEQINLDEEEEEN